MSLASLSIVSVKSPRNFEALISGWGSFTCRKSTTRDPRLYFPSERSHIQDFFTLWKNPSIPAGIEPANLGSSGEYDNHGTTGVGEKERHWIGMTGRKFCQRPGPKVGCRAMMMMMMMMMTIIITISLSERKTYLQGDVQGANTSTHSHIKSVNSSLGNIVIHHQNYHEFTNITTLPKFTLLVDKNVISEFGIYLCLWKSSMPKT